MSAAPPLWASGALALGFVLVHLLSGRLHRFTAVPRSIWLSAAGGTSVAYVFVHLLPELAAHQEAFARAADAAGGPLAGLERHLYLVAMAGLTLFYGLDRLVRRAGAKSAGEGEADFVVHLVSFALYNLLIGYLLVHRDAGGAAALAAYGVALGLHLLVNDQALRQHHGAEYDRFGRWLLAASPVAGWLLGLALTVSEAALAAAFAFLAGGIVLNVLKEELPEDRRSRFSAFLAGGAVYAALLVATGA
jgi:zinc transporter ZupT